MNRAIPLTLIWCFSMSSIMANQQEATEVPNAPEVGKEPVLTAPAAADPAKVIVTVIGADAKRSDVLRKVVDALEKAGIARSDVPPESKKEKSGITTRIGIQQHEPYDKIIAMVKALQYAGVQHMAFGKPPADGKNTVFLTANKPQRSEDISRIERAARQSAKENGLDLEVFTAIPAQAYATSPAYRPPSSAHAANPWTPGPAYPTEIKDLMNSGIDPRVLREQIVQLRDEYKSANKRAHVLAASLRRSPDATKKAELRSTVLNAFLSRQRLLQSELMEMQTRLIQSQASLKNRERIRNQIVDRRVEDLLNPQLEWEETRPIDLPGESERPRNATTVPPASEQQKARWRSAIVDIHIVTPDSEVLVGRGIVVSPTGLILTNTTKGYHLEDDKVIAFFDDGRRVSLSIIDDSGAGFYSLQTPTGTQINHYFDCAAIPHAVGDEVYICGYKTDGSHDFEVLPTKLVLNDRKVPSFGTPCWQLQHVPTLGTLFCQPLIAADGRLVGLTTAGLGKPNEPLLACSAAGFGLVFAKAKLNVASGETPSSSATTIPAKWSTVPETTVTELEGEWHQVAHSDGEGVSHQRHLYNRTFKGDRSTLAWAGGSKETRITVNPDAKTIRYFNINGQTNAYTMQHYELQGDQLVIMDNGFGEGVRVRIYERGYVPIPNVAPPTPAMIRSPRPAFRRPDQDR